MQRVNDVMIINILLYIKRELVYKYCAAAVTFSLSEIRGYRIFIGTAVRKRIYRLEAIRRMYDFIFFRSIVEAVQPVFKFAAHISVQLGAAADLFNNG